MDSDDARPAGRERRIEPRLVLVAAAVCTFLAVLSWLEHDPLWRSLLTSVVAVLLWVRWRVDARRAGRQAGGHRPD